MILSGIRVAQQIQEELKGKVESYGGSRKPHLAVILVGFHPPSRAYVNAKREACRRIGIAFSEHLFNEEIDLPTLLVKIKELNEDPSIDGILVQSPLPSHLPYEKVIEELDPKKDVDGFHPMNMGKLLLGIEGGFIPCTPLGIQTLLEYEKIPINGKHVVIVGRSNIVGKPLGALFLQKGVDATVTIVHSQTKELSKLTLQADILVAAIGKPHFIKEEMVKEGSIVIDVGINRIDDPKNPKGYSLTGDVDFEKVEKKCAAITPVPKGVGPMTVAMLLRNTLWSYEKNHRL